ncbi:MAG: molybdopterin-dependent oxidoreductase [Desulfomonile tiedjei]|nr:molybdopterin-dependent oxidoreductase [Desulfomonile tiedjei]
MQWNLISLLSRRNFIRRISAGLLGSAFAPGVFFSFRDRALAQLAETTQGDPLKDKNPKDVDASTIEITPLKDFGTMGLDGYKADTEVWRLIVEGHVENKLSISYRQLLDMPFIEKPVLMICPGIFVNHGLWRGISAAHLLKLAKISGDVNYVSFRGPEGNYEKVMRVPLKDIVAEKVFLAHHVNGEALPAKHGFPLRLVAEGYYGYDWVKYVYKITAEIVPA